MYGEAASAAGSAHRPHFAFASSVLRVHERHLEAFLRSLQDHAHAGPLGPANMAVGGGGGLG